VIKLERNWKGDVIKKMGEFQEELKDFFGENMNILFRADFKCQVQ
jgi:hypothetical protein